MSDEQRSDEDVSRWDPPADLADEWRQWAEVSDAPPF